MKKIKETKKSLTQLGNDLVEQIEKKQNPTLEVPIRSLSNVRFNPETKLIELGAASAKRYFFNVGHVKKFVQTVEAAAVSKELLDIDKHLSLREMYYKMRRTIPETNINVIDDQIESNAAVEDLELITGASREQLHVNANKLGSVAGKVIVKDRGDTIDWSKMGSGGWSIPSNTEDIVFKKVDAKFVIYLEKAAEWERLHEDKLWDKLDCIILSSQGQATRGIRRLLQRLHTEFKLPIYVLVDGDPWGVYIYSVLKYGSISLAHISEELAIPGCKMLGLTADDVIKYDLKKHVEKFKEVDLNRLNQVKNYEWFKDKEEWQRQFKMWKEIGGKVELAALTSRGITFISDTYIPNKIKNKEWLD